MDTGCDNNLTIATKPQHITPENTGNLTVAFGKPGSHAESVGTGTFTSNGVSVPVYYMDANDLRDNLLSLDAFVDQDCIVTFDKTTGVITKDGQVILRSVRVPGTSGWRADLSTTRPDGPPAEDTDGVANRVQRFDSIDTLVA